MFIKYISYKTLNIWVYININKETTTNMTIKCLKNGNNVNLIFIHVTNSTYENVYVINTFVTHLNVESLLL